MANDFYDICDQRETAPLFSMECDTAFYELVTIFQPASKQWGEILALGQDTRILSSQIDYLLELIDRHPGGESHREFYQFLVGCRDKRLDLKIVAD